MRIDPPWANAPETLRLCAAIEAAGYQALFVGGAVRNVLLGLPVSDFDMSSDARPEVVTAIAKAAGFHVIPTGIEHGTVTVIAGGAPHEITTFRRDVATDGRHAEVAYSTSIAEDAARRDFTMNAIYARADGEILDPLGGLGDAKARRLRFVGAPAARIREDYLRSLRFFRFFAHYADPAHGIDPEALAAIAANLDGLAQLSRERVGHEMRKLLAAPDPGMALAAMQTSGVLQSILPGTDARQIPVLVHLEAGLAPDWLRRLALIGGTDLTEALRLSRNEAKALATLKTAMSLPPETAAYHHGAKAALDAQLVLAAMMEQPVDADLPARIEAAAAQVFPVKAQDLPKDLKGPEIGQALRDLTQSWIESGFTLSAEALLNSLKPR